MNISWILRVFLYFGLTGVSVVQSTKWVDKLTNYIVKDSGVRQVTLITKDGECDKFESPIIDELFVELLQSVPILRISIADDLVEDPKKSTFNDDATKDSAPIETPATLFLLIHETRDITPVLPSKRLIDAIAEMSSFHYRPKYLIVIFARKASESLEKFLEYAWTKQLLDLTVLEFVETKVVKNLRKINHLAAPPTIHWLNPFEKVYTKSKWTADINELFPNKVSNGMGHPLRIRAVNYPPFSIAEFNERHEPVKIGGPDILILQAIAERLNFTLKYIPSVDTPNDGGNITDLVGFIYSAMESDKIDLESILFTHLTTSKYSTLRTTSLSMVKYCPVVPILFTKKMPDYRNVWKAGLLSFGIIVTFWIVRRVFRFQASLWQAFYIGRLLFGVSVTRQPDRTGERFIFACLVVISAIYSSTIYAAITDISLQTEVEMEFTTFEDLDNSGLIPVIGPVLFNKTFNNVTGALMNLKNKSVLSVVDTLTCAQIAAEHKNITCFMSGYEAELAVEITKREGLATLKIARPCFWSDSLAFITGKRSPYRYAIDDVIMRMQTAGLTDKFFNDERMKSKKSNDVVNESLLEIKQSMIALRYQLLAIVIVGYSLSIFVFIGEIVVHRIKKYRQSKKIRPVIRTTYIE